MSEQWPVSIIIKFYLKTPEDPKYSGYLSCLFVKSTNSLH